MTDADADKINRFYELGKDDPDTYGKSQTAILVVGNIPSGADIDDILWSIENEAYNDNGKWPNKYNFETIDGDYFAAYPGINHKGKFELFGDDSNYLCDMDSRVNRESLSCRKTGQIWTWRKTSYEGSSIKVRKLAIAYGNSRQAKKWVNKEITFDELKIGWRLQSERQNQ